MVTIVTNLSAFCPFNKKNTAEGPAKWDLKEATLRMKRDPDPGHGRSWWQPQVRQTGQVKSPGHFPGARGSREAARPSTCRGKVMISPKELSCTALIKSNKMRLLRLQI